MQPLNPVITPFLHKLSPLRMIDTLAIAAIPIWTLFKFYPKPFNTIAMYLPLEKLPIWIPDVTIRTINILAPVSIVFLIGLLFLLCIKLFKFILRNLFGMGSYSTSSDRFNLTTRLGTMFARCALYMTALGVYSELILNDHAPMVFLQSTNIFWLSIVPSWAIIIVLVVGFFLF